MAKQRKKKLTKAQGIIYLIIAIAVFIYSGFNEYILKDNKQASYDISKENDTVAILNVGQADSSLISSNGEYCLIDAGETRSKEIGVVEYLNNAGVQDIKLLVITHFHHDHTSEVIDVIDNFNVQGILIPTLTKNNMPTTQFFESFLTKVEEKNIPIYSAKGNDIYPIGNGVLRIVDDTMQTSETNNTSVITTFTQGDFIYLNTGDAEKACEENILSLVGEVTLFKAGHHGSLTSNTPQLLSIIQPKFIAISAGENNSYGHPDIEVLDNMAKTDAQINQTFIDGTLIYSIKEKKLLTAFEK